MRDKLVQRVEMLRQSVDQSLANHNALIGRKLEAEDTLKAFDEHEAVKEPEIECDGSK